MGSGGYLYTFRRNLIVVDGSEGTPNNNDLSTLAPNRSSFYVADGSSTAPITGDYFITGFNGGMDGRILIVENFTDFNMIILHDNANSAFGNRIFINANSMTDPTPTLGVGVSFPKYACAEFIYDPEVAGGSVIGGGWVLKNCCGGAAYVNNT